MSFRLKFRVITFLLISGKFLSGQNTVMPEYNLNKNLPGAVYKFSFVHITDTHIGEGISDYGSPGFFNDTIPLIDDSKPTKSLKQAVKWINNNQILKNIKFVVVSGDLTGSAEKSEFLKFKEIMNGLDVPYVPLIGNHDVWPYVQYENEAPYACGDSVINEVFEDVYDNDALFFTNWNDGTRKLRTYNPESLNENYLQNFSFEYDNFLFYMLDFNPRYHVNKAEPGIGPEAQLMDWNGGTFQWLKNDLANQPNKKNKNILFVSHHPATDNLLFILSGFVFEFDEFDKLTNMLLPYSQNLALWMTGHIHINYEYPLITLSRKEIMTVRGMAANKDFDSAYFEIVNVYEVPNITYVSNSFSKESFTLAPNPNSGKFITSTEFFSQETEVLLFNVVGKLIFQKPIKEFKKNETYEFDFSELPKGIYNLTLKNDGIMRSQKLIIQ